MIKKIQLRMIYIFGILLQVLLLIAYSFTVWQVVDGMRARAVLLTFGIAFLLTGLLVIYMVRKRITQFTDVLNTYLDDMIAKKDSCFDVQYEETLLARIQNKLVRVRDIFNRFANENMQEKLALQGLVSDVSHQVKTPMANIKMYNGILLDRPTTKEQQLEFQKIILTQVDKLDFLMQSMIKMSRLETGILQMNFKESCIYDTILLAVASTIPMAERKNITLSINCDQDSKLPHDEKWTAEALFNIIDNAVKYTSPNGAVKIDVERWEFYTKIDISDNGKGIDECNHAAIFKRFFREDSVQEQEGIGIGLYLAREIISMQQGYIKVQSKSGKGAVFSVFIPN